MNTTTYVRSPRNNKDPFTRISNSIAKLPAVEAGIMLQILSNSDDWVINKKVVRDKSGLGEVSFTKAWNHLKELGYITRRMSPTQNGQFCHHYTIHEIPEVQNPLSEIDNPSMDNRSTETHTTVTGGTNNNYIINNEEKISSGIVSNALATKCRERHDQKEIRPNILDQENINEDNLQIVPPPQHCFGSVRDNDEDHNKGPNITSPSLAPNNTIPIIPVKTRRDQPEDHQEPLSIEVWYSGKDEISLQTQEILRAGYPLLQVA